MRTPAQQAGFGPASPDLPGVLHSCNTCGALVLSTYLWTHRDWHDLYDKIDLGDEE